MNSESYQEIVIVFIIFIFYVELSDSLDYPEDVSEIESVVRLVRSGFEFVLDLVINRNDEFDNV